MEHIGKIVKRVMADIAGPKEPQEKYDADQIEMFQCQFDEAMGELDAQQARYDDEAEQAGLGRATYRGDVRLRWW